MPSERDKKIIDVFPPPPLHLIKLGPVNKVYNESMLDKFINTHGYFRKHNQTEDEGIMLLSGVIAYNSYHIGSK